MSVKAKLSTRSLDGIDPDLARFLLDIGRRMDAIADIDPAATNTAQNAKINEILAALRDAGKMVD